jgi:hypothetical protein
MLISKIKKIKIYYELFFFLIFLFQKKKKTLKTCHGTAPTIV